MTIHKLTNEEIKALEAAGFRRWTKGDYDRLYISPLKLGLKLDHYRTGKICSAWFDGEAISNAQGGRIANAKIWVDADTGEAHSKGTASGLEDELAERAQALAEEIVDIVNEVSIDEVLEDSSALVAEGAAQAEAEEAPSFADIWANVRIDGLSDGLAWYYGGAADNPDDRSRELVALRNFVIRDLRDMVEPEERRSAAEAFARLVLMDADFVDAGNCDTRSAIALASTWISVAADMGQSVEPVITLEGEWLTAEERSMLDATGLEFEWSFATGCDDQAERIASSVEAHATSNADALAMLDWAADHGEDWERVEKAMGILGLDETAAIADAVSDAISAGDDPQEAVARIEATLPPSMQGQALAAWESVVYDPSNWEEVAGPLYDPEWDLRYI